MDAIYKRRSIRRYRDKAIPEDLIQKILKAGMNAPSAGNEQPWHFIVVDDREVLDQIPKFHPQSKMLHEAPAAIVVCADVANV